MKQLLIPLLCSWTLLLYSCKQEPEPQLPPETQTGANTFGCMVNGKLWLPEGDNGTNANLIAYLGNTGTFSVSSYKVIGPAVNSYEPLQRIPINIKGLTKTGTYYLEKEKSSIEFSDKTTNCIYIDILPNQYFSGKIEITKFDLVNNIVSGRFEAVLKAPDCDTIKITNGRFDVKPL